MDYFAQVMAKDRQRDLIREADDARLRSRAGSSKSAGKPTPRNPRLRQLER